ncbi:hypothetical protein [Nakamurella sp.]|uniref:hypothetical protein n=1 Tax=Nakamurella sp. TaxID=1869182 RepID=UPI003B3AAF48
MPAVLVELHVEMEDGTTHDVVADQRDVAKWEIQDFGCPFADIDARPHLALRWLAWSALSRRGLTTLSWPDFDAVCIEAGDPGEPKKEADGPGVPADGVDPGLTGPSAPTSSPSPGALVNR